MSRGRRLWWKVAAFGCLCLAPIRAGWCEPVEVSSPQLRQIKVDDDRPTGRIIIYANYSSHRVIINGVEFPGDMSDRGVEVVSNEIHEVKVVSSGGVEKKYRLSVNPGQTLALYVDFGATKAKKDENKGDGKDDSKKDDVGIGYLTVRAEVESQVFIDGRVAPKHTPLIKHPVKSGMHSVKVQFLDPNGRGKFSKTKELHVAEGQTMSLTFSKE